MQDELLLKADMPGVGADGVSLNYDSGTLTLHGAVNIRQSEGVQYLMQEYGIADFHREFSINEEIDPDGISAEYKNGVLTVRMPKAEAAKPRRIEVKAH
jgi:HSP20 family molecular chaperone IbpA